MNIYYLLINTTCTLLLVNILIVLIIVLKRILKYSDIRSLFGYSNVFFGIPLFIQLLSLRRNKTRAIIKEIKWQRRSFLLRATDFLGLYIRE